MSIIERLVTLLKTAHLNKYNATESQLRETMTIDEKTKGIVIKSDFVDINEVELIHGEIGCIDRFRIIKSDPDSIKQDKLKPKKPYFRINERY